MFETATTDKLKTIWDNYLQSGRAVIDTKGIPFNNIDKSRKDAIVQVRKIIDAFETGSVNLYEFKTNLDSYNKQNNLWGFTAAKGQMFFNLLTKSSDGNIEKLTVLLKEVIKKPISLEDGLSKIKALYDYASQFKLKATDKRKVANPMSSAYFLSYFWQIHDATEWPIIYSSIIISFQQLGIWKDYDTPYENYKSFYYLNEEAKNVLGVCSGHEITNWDLEHALWNFSGATTVNSKEVKSKTQKSIPTSLPIMEEQKILNPGFELHEYVIPRVAKLVEAGIGGDKSSSAKGSEYEKLVGEVFKYLDFEVEMLGQGTGREPDAIIKFPEDHIAFIVDAKAYSSGYTLGTDDRAMREYINYYCPRLKQSGFNKIGFIIVSNSFKSDFSELINDITWTTDIKRFLLLTSEALLYLLAYKTKDKLALPQIIEAIISFHTVITKEKVIEEFGDY